jgi:hypothetical protein
LSPVRAAHLMTTEHRPNPVRPTSAPRFGAARTAAITASTAPRASDG